MTAYAEFDAAEPVVNLARKGGWRLVVLGLLVSHAVLLAWIGIRASPNCDEVAHLPAGLYVWHCRRFRPVRREPAASGAVAVLPMLLFHPQTDWRNCRSATGYRPEWIVGLALVRANGWGRAYWFFTFARLACVPFSVIGGWICWRWAGELYGAASQVLAAGLVLLPERPGWGATICPDVAAAAIGVAAAYCFWRWLMVPTWECAFVAGLVLGVAELTKATWIILFGMWPALWLLWAVGTGLWSQRSMIRHAASLAAMLALGLYVLNAGYAFEGTFQSLGEYTFVSRTLAGPTIAEQGGVGNRFSGTALGRIPIPLPRDYVNGIDLQKLDFEEGTLSYSYLCGEWKHGGWWYYYLVCAVLKVPLGTWALGVLAIGATVVRGMTWTGCGLDGLARRGFDGTDATGGAWRRVQIAGWRSELVLLAPAVTVLVLVSSQSGFNRYFRYVLPCFPFAYIWISKIASVPFSGSPRFACVVVAALAWSVGSSFWVYPHSTSYFNELAGGPTGGDRYLLDANIDWGQDLLYLKRWAEQHPEASPLYVASKCLLSPELFGMKVRRPPGGPAPEKRYSEAEAKQLGPRPGWYAMSIDRIRGEGSSYGYFLQFKPVAMVGYSTYIYHITIEEANRVRRGLGLPELLGE